MTTLAVEIDVFAQAAQLKQAGRSFVLATVVRAVAPTSARAGDKAILTPEGVSGWVGGSCAESIVRDEADAALADGQPRLVRITPDTDAVLERAGLNVHRMTCFSGGELDIYLEPHVPPPSLVVFGTSPVARALVELGRVMKYAVTIVDLREGPESGAIRQLSQLPAFEPSSTAMVVSSHGVFDEEALTYAVGTKASYLGLVASTRRREQVLSALVGRGVDRDVLARVRAPAGLDLGARTAEEVALTIFAELVAQRRGKAVPKPVSAAQVAVAPLDAPKAELLAVAPAKACCHAKTTI